MILRNRRLHNNMNTRHSIILRTIRPIRHIIMKTQNPRQRSLRIRPRTPFTTSHKGTRHLLSRANLINPHSTNLTSITISIRIRINTLRTLMTIRIRRRTHRQQLIRRAYRLTNQARTIIRRSPHPIQQRHHTSHTVNPRMMILRLHNQSIPTQLIRSLSTRRH